MFLQHFPKKSSFFVLHLSYTQEEGELAFFFSEFPHFRDRIERKKLGIFSV